MNAALELSGLKSAIYYVLLAAVVVAGPLFKVWVHQDATRLGYALNAEERRATELRGMLRQLEVETAALRSPTRLSGRAEQLHLQPPIASQLYAGVDTSRARLAAASPSSRRLPADADTAFETAPGAGHAQP